ncbi:hypothetical protein [Lelliottia nimipressuralis]|uniref:Uncharacterized protein n=1 Tax=Lelliottia nimipressuralis TaxID=69220 RepID=A0ABD4KF34_9ENTR|nr:hypothetical protein [Lelliottia nimipressuralis]MBF4179683.1 hypothetical protein [Lelliottia nimipressuralis]
MFDIFGIKAKRQVRNLKQMLAERDGLIDDLVQKGAEAYRMECAREAHISGLNGQLIAVRRLANEMRDRVRSHGKTTAEHEFIRACMDIFNKGKKMSEHRFNYSMVQIKRERESLENSPEWEAAQ